MLNKCSYIYIYIYKLACQFTDKKMALVHGLILFLAVLLQKTFKAVKAWIHELRNYGPQDIVLAIAGNKCDLEDLREVSEKGGSHESFCFHS